MARLQLGVDDVPYSAPPEASAKPRKATKAGKGRRKARKTKGGFLNWIKSALGRHPSYAGVITTADVAGILEEKYGVMAFFAQEHGQEIADEMAKSAGQAFETVAMGGPATDPFASAKSAIEAKFRHFIDAREMDGKVEGVATEAAKKGVNHRLKHPYAKGNPERPSFRDTGLYQANMRATFEE